MARLSISWSGLLTLAALYLNILNTFAQSICDNSPLTVTTVAQLEELTNCTSLTGDLILQYVDTRNITIDSLKYVGGMMQIHLADNSQRISAENLTSIGGLFMIAGGVTGESDMKNVSFPLLNTTAGLDFSGMPKLRKLAFPKRINNPVPAIRVTIINTGLDTIEDMNIDYLQLQQVYFGGNPNMKEIKMGLNNITVNLDIDGLTARPNVSFPELTYMNTANIHGVSSINFGKLESMGGALGVYDCTNLTELKFPKLKEIGTRTLSVLAIANNTKLEDVEFPEMEAITGGITTENNPSWKRLNGFPKLESVTDDVNMSGAYTLVDFPMLYSLTGAFKISSSSGLTYNCKDLEKINTDTSKQFICDPHGVNVFRAAEGDEPVDNKPTDEGTLTGPKITGIAIGCLAAVIVPLLCIRYLLVQKRKRSMIREKDHSFNFHGHGPRELDSRSTRPSRSRAELPASPFGTAYELPAAKLRQELPGDIPLYEMDDDQRYKKSAEVSTFPVPDSPIERIYSSRVQSDVSSEDDYHSSIRNGHAVTVGRGI